MSIDIPSGLNADTGQKMGTAVKADLTVTFGFPKPGQLVYPGAGLVGRLINIDIGIPGTVSRRFESSHRLIEPKILFQISAGIKETRTRVREVISLCWQVLQERLVQQHLLHWGH